MTLLDLCAYLGLGAAGAATVNLLLGLLIALRYSPKRHWPHRHINVFLLHQWTAYLAVFFTLTHPVVLLFLRAPAPHFRLIDILWPIHSPLQPKLNLAGAGALYLLLLVFVSSLLRTRIGRPLWRNLHYLVYPAAALLLLHSILTDPNLKDGHPDLLDGGKIFVEIAALISFLAIAARVWLRGRGLRPARATPAPRPEPVLEDEIA
ncbi:MAG TPA: ferric reductase-like transmembrane domain-containing protein [Terracidiphilus sp.]|nr:ferric reductase-like transmembrane domain-containing protein [Terracidiphilus sp.]